MLYSVSKIKVIASKTKLDAIEQYASVLFRQKGYVATSVKDIAEQVGIEAPSLYNHISSKLSLLHNICFSVAKSFEDEMNKAANETNSPAGELEVMLRFHIQMMLQNFDALWVANHEWKHLPVEDLKIYIEKRKAYESKVQSLIEQGIAAKELTAVDVKMATLIILAALRGLEFWQKEKQLLNLTVIENNIIQQLFKGLIQ